MKPIPYIQEMGDTKNLYLGGPHMVLPNFSPPFCLLLFNLEKACWTRKGITFWTESLIINLAEELGFRGLGFNPHSCFNLPHIFQGMR